MQSRKPDLNLSDIQVEPRKFTLEIAKFDPDNITLLDALDIQDVSGIEAGGFSDVLKSVDQRKRALLLYAFAWIIARKIEPGLTFDEVCTYHLNVIGHAPTEQQKERSAHRAKVTMGVAMATGLPPEQVEQLSISQVSAVADIRSARRRRR